MLFRGLPFFCAHPVNAPFKILHKQGKVIIITRKIETGLLIHLNSGPACYCEGCVRVSFILLWGGRWETEVNNGLYHNGHPHTYTKVRQPTFPSTSTSTSPSKPIHTNNLWIRAPSRLIKRPFNPFYLGKHLLRFVSDHCEEVIWLEPFSSTWSSARTPLIVSKWGECVPPVAVRNVLSPSRRPRCDVTMQAAVARYKTRRATGARGRFTPRGCVKRAGRVHANSVGQRWCSSYPTHPSHTLGPKRSVPMDPHSCEAWPGDYWVYDS